MTCDVAGLKAMAVLSECKRVINDELKISTRDTAKENIQNLGCVYHDAHSGWAQIIRKNGDPMCETEGTIKNMPKKQRVCKCRGKYYTFIQIYLQNLIRS